MVSHWEVAVDFSVRKNRCNGTNMFIRDGIVYSWRQSYPIACWIGEKVVLFNDESLKYTMSTRRHASLVANALFVRGVTTIFVPLVLLKKHIDGGHFLLSRAVNHESMEDCLMNLRFVLRKGASPYRVGWFIRKLKEDIRKFTFFEEL